MIHCPLCHVLLSDKAALAEHLMEQHGDRVTGPPLPPHLARVADGIIESWSNKDIAYHLGTTEGTVKQYLSEAYRRTGCDKKGTPRVAFALWWAERKREAEK